MKRVYYILIHNNKTNCPLFLESMPFVWAPLVLSMNGEKLLSQFCGGCAWKNIDHLIVTAVATQSRCLDILVAISYIVLMHASQLFKKN